MGGYRGWRFKNNTMEIENESKYRYGFRKLLVTQLVQFILLSILWVQF